MINKLLFISIITALLNANDLEQQKYLNEFYERVNNKIEKLKDLPRKETHIKRMSIDENYTINLFFNSNLEVNVTSDIKEDFETMNKIIMKRKFCRHDYFERMKDGLIINFSYHTKEDELITKFSLDENSCKEAHDALLKLK